MSDVLVHVEHLTKIYPSGARPALDNVNLEVACGEFIAVMGRSGSGKTTLLNILGGLDMQWKGRVLLKGKDLHAMNDRELSRLRNQMIGFVFQAFHLLPHLTVLENVLLPTVFGSCEGDMTGRGLTALWRVGLEGKEKARPTELSAGEKQRVAIARAILNNPALLLCDEPTGNLDKDTGRTVLEIFAELNRAERTTLIVATHEPRVSEVATRQIVLDCGRMVQ